MRLNTKFMQETFLIALKGIPVTLQITFVSLLIAMPIAFFMAEARIHKIPVWEKIVTFYVSIVRGTPIVLQILIVYSLLPSLLNVLVLKLHLNIHVFELNPIIYAYIVFSFNTMATLSEVFRSALTTVSNDQLEAALSAGLTNFQSYKRIIIPQALVSAIPNVCTLTVNLLKNTSLAFMMTVKDITALAKIQASFGFNYIEAYIDLFVIYLVICSVIQVCFRIVEKCVSLYKQTSVKPKNKKEILCWK